MRSFKFRLLNTSGDELITFEITGPLSYLFHSVHEQTHVAHVVAYAMCAGPYREDSCARNAERNPRTLFGNGAENAKLPTLCKILIVAFVVYLGG